MRQAHQEYLDSLEPLPAARPAEPGRAGRRRQSTPAGRRLRHRGRERYALYPHRYRQFAGPGTSGADAGRDGLRPAGGLSAKLEHPQRTVVCYAGDGCFQMNMQELGVAQQYRLGVVVLVFNNGMWGTIRAHQEREFPGRPIALGFENPDFAQIARGYRGYGEIVTRTEDFAAAFERARWCRARTPARAAGHPLRRRRHRARPDPVGHPRRRPGAPGRSPPLLNPRGRP